MSEQCTFWTNAIREIIPQIAGIVFFCCGISLLSNKTKAFGRVNLKLMGFTANIQAESAGIFICCFGFLLIIIPALIK